MDRWRPNAQRVALACVSLLLALGLAEIGLRLLDLGPLAVNPDQRHFWRHDPVLGWHSHPGREGPFSTEFFDVQVSINSRGLRDAETTLEKPDGIRRVVVIGDSFAWGYGVEQAETFSSLLESALPATEVINGGVSGYSTDQALLWLRREGLRYDPDVVVYALSGNDDAMNHMRRVYWVYHKPSFRLTRGGDLTLEWVPVPQPSIGERVRHGLRATSALASAIESAFISDQVLFMGLAHPLPDPSDPHGLTVALVNAMRESARGVGASLIVLANSDYWFSQPSGSYERLLAELRGAGHDAIGIESQPGWNSASMQIPGDGHWNAEGHAFVAAVLAERLRAHLDAQAAR